MNRARGIAVIVLVLAGVFAYAGGTYSQANYRALRREEAEKAQRLAMLTREVDSLRAFRDSLATNPVVQERVARQKYGMLRPGELTFTIISGDTTRRDSTARR